MDRKRSRKRDKRAFTLFEVILAATILVFLVGGVFLAVSTAVSAATTLGEVQIQARRVSAFQDFLRRGFLNLPTAAEIRVRSVPHGGGSDEVELVIRNAAGAFAIGALGRKGSGIVLGTESNGKGQSVFTVTRFPSALPGDQPLNEYLEKASRLPLLEGIENVRWRFWDQTERRFVETWDRGTEHPSLIELDFQLTGETPKTCVFYLPSLSQQ